MLALVHGTQRAAKIAFAIFSILFYFFIVCVVFVNLLFNFSNRSSSLDISDVLRCVRHFFRLCHRRRACLFGIFSARVDLATRSMSCNCVHLEAEVCCVWDGTQSNDEVCAVPFDRLIASPLVLCVFPWPPLVSAQTLNAGSCFVGTLAYYWQLSEKQTKKPLYR